MTDKKATDTMITDTLILIEWEKSYKHSVELFDAIGKKDDRKAFPSDYEYWAKAAFHTGRLEDAAHIYRKYLEFEPSWAAEIYSLIAKAYYDSSNYEQAINYYKRKNEVKPLTNSEEYYKGLSHYYSKQWNQADTSFAKVLAATPDYATGWFWRARINNQLDSLPDSKQYAAKPFYEKYIELASVDSLKNKKGLIEAYHYMAVYWINQEEKGNVTAKEYYQKILELDPADETAIENLKILNGR